MQTEAVEESDTKKDEKYGRKLGACSLRREADTAAPSCVNNEYSMRELIRLGPLSPACVAEDILLRVLSSVYESHF